MLCRPGLHLRKAIAQFRRPDQPEADEALPEADVDSVSPYEDLPHTFLNGLTKMVDNLKDSLDGRFRDINESILKATRIADLKAWPSKENAFGKLQQYYTGLTLASIF
jgi:hypothetical protein